VDGAGELNMTINTEMYRAAATKGEVARLAIKTRMMALSIRSALRALEDGETGSLRASIKQMEEMDSELDKLFNDLTGWTEE